MTFLMRPVQSCVDKPCLKPNCKEEVENANLWSIKMVHSKILLSVGEWADNCLSQKGLFPGFKMGCNTQSLTDLGT